jgi:DNA (cytosine-5)-methyltransferase 1
VNVLDLFSGIGGFSLGLERAGMRTVAFCEIDPYARAVLAARWPDVPCYDDIRELGAGRLASDGIAVDVICGGFPCQDISTAGRGEGIDGERSGLWREYARLVGELRPRFVIVENVAALLARGLELVLGDLAALGYDAEWHCVPASAIGAPHRRDRVWIVAHPCGSGLRGPCAGTPVEAGDAGTRDLRETVADPVSERRPGPGESIVASYLAAHGEGQAVDAFDGGIGQVWSSEPRLGRVAHGVPNRAHRLRCLGNAVVPQIPEIIGRAIIATEAV